MGNSHNKLLKKLSSTNEEEILEGIKQLKKTLDATSSSAYNEFLLQCLQVIGRVLATDPNRFSKGFLISFIKHLAFLPELPVMTVDTRIKNELFEHVISKLVLAVYTHDVEISLKALAVLQHLFTEQQGQRSRAFPEWKPFMNALIAYKMTNMNQTRDHVRALVDAAAALVNEPHFSTVVALFSEILVHEPDPTCQSCVLQLIVNLLPKFGAMSASVLSKLLQTLIKTIDQHGEENSAHVTSLAYQCLQLFIAQHAALVDWTALLVHVIGQQIFAAKSRDWEVLNLALLSTAVDYAPLEDNVRHVLQSLSYFRKKFQRNMDTFDFPDNEAELMQTVLQILTRVISRAPPPVTWGSRGYYVMLVLITLPFFAARNELVELSCDIINHVEGLEPQKHVIATHLLFLAKYLHPHTILTKLRLPNEFPEPAAVQMSKIIPLDLALGAPRPALNLFQFFTEFNHVSVSNNDFQAELQTRVKSSIASLTTLLTRGLRCQSLDSGSFSYLLTFIANQLPLDSALLTRVWCQVLFAVTCQLAHSKDQFMNRTSISINQERETATAEVRNLRARLEEKLRDNEVLSAKVATMQGHVDTAQRERDTLAQSLTCPICYEDFTKKGAVSIDCGHILCAGCQQLVSAGPVAQRLCPICRHVITSPRPLKGLG